MATLYYRAMIETNGKPKIGRSARCLGVRVEISNITGVRPRNDIDIEQVPESWLDEQGYLKPDFEQKEVSVLIRVLREESEIALLTPWEILIETEWLDQHGYWNPSDNLITVVIRNGKGMSTSLSIESLEEHRRPRSFGGVGKDPLWEIDDRFITGDLEALQDSPTHVSIVPRVTMRLDRYESALASTQKDWQRVE